MEDLVRLAVIFVIITLVIVFFILETIRHTRESARSGYIVDCNVAALSIILTLIVLLILIHYVAASREERCYIVIVAFILLMAPLVLLASRSTARR